MEQHFVRSSVRAVERPEALELGGMKVRSNEQRFFGRFRCQLQLSRNRGMESVGVVGIRGVTEGSEQELGELSRRRDQVEYIDISIGDNIRQWRVARRRGIDGGEQGIVKRRRRLRQRRMVALKDFKLFENSGNHGSNDENEGQTGVGSEQTGASDPSTPSAPSGSTLQEGNMLQDSEAHGRVQDLESGITTQRDKFKKSIEECNRCADLLFNGWADVQFLRFSGGRRRNQKYRCVSTVRMCQKNSDGKWQVTVILNLTIEEESRKVSNICIRRDVRMDRVGDSGGTVEFGNDTTIMCSFHAR